jgi:hypothetical protein
MKTRILLLSVLLVILASCGVKVSESYYDQPVKILRAEYDGSYVIRSSGKGRNAAAALAEARKQAVYDVVFNGVPSTTSTVSSLKPLLLEVNAKTKYQDYFNSFFADGGEYLNYISIEDKRATSSNWFRGESQVTCQTNVTVNVAALKAKLQNDNILK